MNYYIGLITRYAIAFLSLKPYEKIQDYLTGKTISLVYYLLNLISAEPVLARFSVKNAIDVYGVTMNIVPSCVSITSYYLFLFLILITKDIKLKLRILMSIIGSLFIFILNLIRMFVLLLVLINYPDFFKPMHEIFNYLISIIFVILIWIFLTWSFGIKSMPVISDFKQIISDIKK